MLRRFPTLTLGVYSHVGLHDQAGALDALPNPDAPAAVPEAGRLAATGSDGQQIGDRLAHYLPIGGGGTGRSNAAMTT
jgi:hypothetical protein